ncbi:MAG: putative manganese transporter [Kiloniellales bacterium]|nr:putative manganese transporter [Kiloniellales bacterium]
MSQLVAALNLSASGRKAFGPRPAGAVPRYLALAVLAAVALSSQETLRIAAEALSEAYLTVAVFVAGTLALVYGLERAFKADIGQVLAGLRRWQVAAGGLLGAFPGCGGAIVIVTQYTKGHVSFGTLVATLTATIGDAMFLLLAMEPRTGLAVAALGLVVGTLFGLIVDALHGQDFLRVRHPEQAASGRCNAPPTKPARRNPLATFWLLLMVPGLTLGLLDAFQVEPGVLVPLPAGFEPGLWIGLAGSLLALGMWAARGEAPSAAQGDTCREGLGERIVADTNFITAWVVFAFLTYELGVHFSGLDLAAAFALWGPLVPLAAILVGFLPGCGPQIVVTTLYLNGSLPLSAQLGNAISNDGDALFPALALAPKAALLATLYSALPALLVAYGYFLLWE